MKFHASLFGTVLLVAVVSGYPGGPPVADHPGICSSMMPDHGYPKQTGTSPYEIVFNTDNCYKTDQKMQVVVRNKDPTVATKIEGVFLMMRPQSGDIANKANGKWTSVDTIMTALTCHGNTDSAIGHNAEQKVTYRSTDWTPSANYGAVKAYVTVVAGKATFWVKVQSEELTHNTNCALKNRIVDTGSGTEIPTPVTDGSSSEEHSGENAAPYIMASVVTCVLSILTFILLL